MSGRHPRVSIGMPVYNGELYIAEAIKSFLAQTFSDFELIISDNASTDRTQEICKVYAHQDGRIRYYRNKKNLGATRNFNRVFELSSGEYFKWAAHDDKCAPEFLAECVDVLDRDSGLALCYPRARLIDARGQVIRDFEVTLDTDSPKPQKRFRSLVYKPHLCFQVFGLIRTDMLKRTPLIGDYVSSDKVLLVQLALLGRFHEIPEYRFLPRRHPYQSTNVYPGRQERIVWFNPTKAGRIIFPNWRVLIEHCGSINSAPLDLNEEISCYFYMSYWVADNWKRLILDLTTAARQFIKPTLRPKQELGV